MNQYRKKTLLNIYQISQDLSIIAVILINCLEKAMATETRMQLLGTSCVQIALLDFPVVKKNVIGL